MHGNARISEVPIYVSGLRLLRHAPPHAAALVTRSLALAGLSLVLAACSLTHNFAGEPAAAPHTPPPSDSETMRRVTGRAAMDAPLLPEPGNVWAGILRPVPAPGEAPGSDAARAAPAAAPSAGRAVAAKPAGMRPAKSTRPASATVAAVTEPARPALAQPAAPRRAAQAKAAPAVQIAASPSARGAEAAWQHLRQLLPQVLGDHHPTVSAAEVDGHQVWRLRTGGFTTVAQASAFCASLHQAKSDCWVVASQASP
jgi:hypothetical protein